jgi:site-specific DNA recombinase
LDRLYDALETSKIKLEDLAPRIKYLRIREEQLRVTRVELERLLSDRHVELADMETVTNHVQDLCSLLGESPLGERRSFVKSFVKKVKVTDNEVLPTYTIPMAPKGINEELGAPFILHYGGRWRSRTSDLLCVKQTL